MQLLLENGEYITNWLT